MGARIRRMLVVVFTGLVLGYALLIVLAYVRQDAMLYYPSREITNTPRDIGLDFEEVTLRTEDGAALSAWYIPARDGRGVVLFCHGNAGNISHRLDSIRIFHDLNLGVLIFDYRGYGRSGGSPTEQGTYHDAESAWEYLVRQRHTQPGKIILFGRSLGSAVAAEIALRRTAGALIIESGFTSVADLGRKYFPYLPVKLIARYRYATIDKVGRIKIPKLFVHSPHDEIVPFGHGEALFERAAEPREFLRIAGGHNEGFLVSGREYIDGLNRFISKYL
jgi:fermentation-respiration switch protein FrsA (DUF1100 family)